MVVKRLVRSAAWRAAACFWGTLICSVLLLGSHVVKAQLQEPDSAPKVGGVKELPSILNDGTIDTTARLYLDDNGKPILVPAESYETFLRGKTEQTTLRNSQNQFPSFVIEQTEVGIDVTGMQAKLTGTFKISLSTTAPRAVAIPLKFESCQLVESPLFTGGGENLVEVRSGFAGYQWYLQGEPGSKHSAILKGGTVVTRQGERNDLKVNLPSSPSSVVVTLPANAIDEKVSGEGNEFFDRETVNGAIVLRIRASGGDLSISWRDADIKNRISAVEANTATTIKIEEPRQVWKVRTDLTLRWFGSDAMDTIVLNLPAGAQWGQLPTSLSENYSVDYINSEIATTQNADPNSVVEPKQVRIRNLDASLMQPINLPLEWEWSPPGEADSTFDHPIRIPSMTIDGVDVHTGTVEFLMPTSYLPTWHEEAGTKLVQQPRSVELFDRNQYLFRFSHQPLQLTARFRRPSNVASIRPTYLTHIDNNKLKLTAWLNCTFDASQPKTISILPADWIVDSVEAVDMATPHASGEPLDLRPQSDGSYTISSFNGEQVGELNTQRVRQTWRVIAYRPLERNDANALAFKLPQLKPGSGDGPDSPYDHGTGLLIVTSSENLLLKNATPLTKGLLIDSLVPQWQPLLGPGEAKQPLVYRFQSRGETPLWSGSAESLPQQIVLAQNVDLQVETSAVRIKQNYELQVANEPLSTLRLAIRQDALQYIEPQVTIDNQLVQLQRINALDSQPDSLSPETASKLAAPEGWQLFEAVSVAPLLGTIQLNVTTGVLWTAQSNSQLTPLRVPLVQLLVPRETRLRDQLWTVRADREIEIHESMPEPSGITSESKPAETVKPESELREADKPRINLPQMITPLAEPRELTAGQTEIVLSARKLESLIAMPVRVGRSWLQTTVNGSERRDRYCAQIESTLSRLSIRIPSSRNLNLVFVNGQRVKFTGEGSQFQVELLGNENRLYQLEVWMTSSESLSWITPLEIDIPEIEGAQFHDRFYWQLAVPAIQHIGFAAGQLTPEWIWKWNGLWWTRESAMEQQDLERWVGATQQTDLPLSVNSYLLSSFGGERSFQIWVLSRFLMWLPIGLAAILVSILLISFRALRHPAILLLAAGGLASAAMLAPDLAVLLGQTALMSLGLVSLILLTQAAIESRVRRRSVFTVRPSQYREQSDHFSLARNVKMSSPSSTKAHSSVVAKGGD
jgi:hypothetical protein